MRDAHLDGSRTKRARFTKTEEMDMSRTQSITPGKLAGLRAVSDARGVIAAAAMDQRGFAEEVAGKRKGRCRFAGFGTG